MVSKNASTILGTVSWWEDYYHFQHDCVKIVPGNYFFFLLVPQEPPEVEQVVVSLGNIKFHICKKKKKKKDDELKCIKFCFFSENEHSS